jgi:branched-chain amino acid transport system substrate-binding protein
MKLAGLLMFINDMHSLGLKATQGMYLTDSWYWNQDAETRAWSRKLLREVQAHAVVDARPPTTRSRSST